MLQEPVEAEATALIGAERHERTESRIVQRKGHQLRSLSTTAGDLGAIPKLQAGSFFPSLLERRRRIDQALFAVVMEVYVTGTSVRKVDDLVKALGADTGTTAKPTTNGPRYTTRWDATPCGTIRLENRSLIAQQ